MIHEIESVNTNQRALKKGIKTSRLQVIHTVVERYNLKEQDWNEWQLRRDTKLYDRSNL